MTCTTESTFRLFDVAEIISELGISRRELNRWRAQGIAPPFLRMPNGSLRMKESALRAWVDEGVPCPLPSVTVAQAAVEFGVEASVFAAWVTEDRIPGVPVDLPSDVRIARALIDAWQVSLREC